MMQTFKQFLSEGRTKPVSAAGATAWMQEHATGYLAVGKFLYRGIRGSAETSILRASSGDGDPRKSIGGMANYYTLWMSHDPKWKGRPRRERSFITSSSHQTAKAWGPPHIVVPSGGSSIGATGANDIWNREVSGLRIAKLTTATRNMFGKFDLDTDVQDYGELRSNLYALKVDDLLDETAGRQGWHFEPDVVKVLRGHAGGTMLDVWRDLLDPGNFSFMTPQHIETTVESADGEELWVDGEALFIPTNSENIPPDDVDHLLSWSAENAPELERELKKHWK